MIRLHLALAASLCSSFALACTGDDSSAAAPPPGPIALAVRELRPAGCAAVTPKATDASTTVSLGTDRNGTVVVVVGDPATGLLTNFTLAAPFACIGVPQCGYVVASVDGDRDAAALSVAASSVAVPLPLGTLSSPLGTHTVRVTLVNSDGTPATNAAGKPYSTTLTLNVTAACTPAPRGDGGSEDASPGDGGAATDGAADGDARGTPDARPLGDAALPEASPTDSAVRTEASSPTDSAAPSDAGHD
ncbi:MAG TPA: hypothetical protein VHE30_02060 [Polyangiaceae bacterium]|nr:hypothetical protein [Polyangiaceae bacterium]